MDSGKARSFRLCSGLGYTQSRGRIRRIVSSLNKVTSCRARQPATYIRDFEAGCRSKNGTSPNTQEVGAEHSGLAAEKVSVMNRF